MVKLIKTRIAPRLTHQVQSFFRAAINMNDVQTVKRLLKHQQEVLSVDATNSEGVTPLHQCAVEGHQPMMSILLRAGADVNVVDRKGWSCLHAAARAGNFNLCEYLLRKGADPMLCTSNKELSIDLSAHSSVTYLLLEFLQQEGHIGLARYHLSRAVAQQKTESEGRRRATCAVIANSSRPQTSILKRRSSSRHPSMSADLESRCSWSSTSSAASTASCYSSVSDDSEADTSSTTSSRSSVQFSNNTLFINYVHENEHQLLDMLLDQNEISILNKLDRKGLSTIHWAAINGFHESVRVLAQHGADVDIVDPNGWTPLHAAVITGKVECIQELLTYGASVYAVTNSGETSFDMTLDEEIRLLLEEHVQSNMKLRLKKSVL